MKANTSPIVSIIVSRSLLSLVSRANLRNIKTQIISQVKGKRKNVAELEKRKKDRIGF